MGLFQRPKHAEKTNFSDGNAAAGPQIPSDTEKGIEAFDDQPVKFLTVRSMLMGVLVSMGGFIFGYDTGTSG